MGLALYNEQLFLPPAAFITLYVCFLLTLNCIGFMSVSGHSSAKAVVTALGSACADGWALMLCLPGARR